MHNMQSENYFRSMPAILENSRQTVDSKFERYMTPPQSESAIGLIFRVFGHEIACNGDPQSCMLEYFQIRAWSLNCHRYKQLQ
jgi:hypothetical protein